MDAIQVSNKEGQEVEFLTRMVTILQGAIHLPELRREVEGLRAEAEALRKEIVDLKTEVELEREAKGKAATQCLEHEVTIRKLNQKLAKLQHSFDTIQGIVQSAMEEARESPQWNPSPVVSFSS